MKHVLKHVPIKTKLMMGLVVITMILAIGTTIYRLNPIYVTDSASMAEICWNMRVSLSEGRTENRWYMGQFTKIGEQHAEVVSRFSPEAVLTPAARQALCTALEQIPFPAPAEPASATDTKG